MGLWECGTVMRESETIAWSSHLDLQYSDAMRLRKRSVSIVTVDGLGEKAKAEPVNEQVEVQSPWAD